MKLKTALRTTGILAFVLGFALGTLQAANAPVTTIATITNAVANQQVTVPVTVTGFTGIAGFTLAIDYPYSKLHYVSGTYNSSLTGFCSIGDNDLYNGNHRLIISWAGGSGVTLANGSWIVKYVFTYITGTAPLTFYDNGPSSVYNDVNYNVMTDVPYSTYYINGSVSQSLQVNTKVFLEGAYSGGSLTTNLRTLGLIPLSQPYSALPWSYAGTESVASIPANVTDWILVELRTGTAASTKVAARAGFLKNNGSITDLDGSSPLAFSGLSTGNYYVVIKHRNHMPVMSATAVALSGSSVLYDFTTGSGQAFGGTAGLKLIDPLLTRWGMIAGDASANGTIYVDDYADYWANSFGSTGTYSRSDFQLDGSVLVDDYTDYWAPNFGMSNILP